MAWTKDQKEVAEAFLSGLAALGITAFTRKHLTSKGFTKAADMLLPEVAGLTAGTVTHQQIKKHLEDNPHHIPAKAT